MKPTQEQINAHFRNIDTLKELVGTCTNFMEIYVDNIRMYKVHGMLARLPKKLEDINCACQNILLKGEKP